MAVAPLSAAVLADGQEGVEICAVLECGGIEVRRRAARLVELEPSLEAELDAIVVSCLASAADANRRVLEAKRRLPRVPVVALVGEEDSGRAVQAALEANAEGVLFGPRAEEALVATVRAVSAGQIALPRSRYRCAPPVVLSHREREVLRLAVGGMTNDSIAAALYISRSTVKSHLTSAFAKLSVRSRSEAAAVLSDPDEPASRLVFGAGGLEPASAPEPSFAGAGA